MGRPEIPTTKQPILRLGAAWIVAVVFGFVVLARHEFAAAPVAQAAEAWPAGATLTKASDRPSLLVFIHPDCPCSIASMDELARLVTVCGDRVDTHVIIYSWPDRQVQVFDSSPWKAAERLPDVSLHDDRDGVLARQFGVNTSGHVLMYNPAGTLLYSGGITGSRAHSGDNASLAAVIALVRDHSLHPQSPVSTSVFGCAIFPETR